MLLSAEKIGKSYTGKVLLKDISLYLNKGDKIGVIGVNGTGKSTLLRILARREEADSGTVSINAKTQMEYLAQDPECKDGLSVLEQVFFGASAALRESKDYEAKTILTKLGITEYDKPVAALSGGQKKRVAIASALMHPSEILILDEPTNHLDNEMIEWLENYLIRYTGAIVMVTHDRYFLDRVVNQIVELEDGKLFSYPGSYSKYLAMKAEREDMELGSERKRKSILRKELEWMQRGPRARGTKSKERIERFEKLSEQNGQSATSKLDMDTLSSRLGKKTVELQTVTKRFGESLVIDRFDHMILRDERIGIVGKNGCGKSTLLNLISGRLTADSGAVDVGETVRMGYFAQDCEEMDFAQRPIDYIKEIAGSVETSEGTVTASQMMEKFLFSSEQQWTTIGELSGGERRRLYLLGILMQAPNILLLDEPTNDLDIQTLTILEDYLERFPGAVVAVSHDRYFLDKVATTIFEFRGDGIIRKCLGDYSDYLAGRTTEANRSKQIKAEPEKKEKSQPKLKLTFKEQREMETIDAEIAELEIALAQLKEQIHTQTSDYVQLQENVAKKETVEKALDEKMERWVYLNDLAEKIAETKNT